MAATVSPWGKPGAWALDSEENEAQLLKEQEQTEQPKPSADFPSLADAAATKPKKKKGQTISLAEFSAYGGAKPAYQSSQPQGRTPDDLVMLPTGPRQRTDEELDRSRLGGGFRNYGSNSSYDRNSRYSSGDDSSNSKGARVFDETRRNSGSFGRDSGGEFAPSRADEIDDWAAAKKPMVGNGFERRERGGFFDSHSSKADESESWVSSKSFVPSEGRRFGATGGGFDRERRGGFTSNGGAADSGNWLKKKDEEGTAGSVTERPRLNLQPRTLPVSNGKPEVPGMVTKPKSSNPFGEARPREEVLAEKGQDWKKIDEQLESMKIKEATEKEEKVNGTLFGKRSFGTSNGRGPGDKIERSWRKPESDESRPQSAEKIENGAAEES